MKLTETEIDTLVKYLPEDKITNILNFKILIDFICNKYNIIDNQLSSDKRNHEITKARFYLVILTIKIFDPYIFEDNVMKGIRTKISNGISNMLSIAFNKNHTIPRYYLNKSKDFLETHQIEIKDINKMELEILNLMKL